MNKRHIALVSILICGSSIVKAEQESVAWTPQDHKIYKSIISLYKADQFNNIATTQMLMQKLDQEDFTSLLYKRVEVLQKEIIDGWPITMPSISSIKEYCKNNYMDIVKNKKLLSIIVPLIVGKVVDMGEIIYHFYPRMNESGSDFHSLTEIIKYAVKYHGDYDIYTNMSMKLSALLGAFYILKPVYKYCMYNRSREAELRTINELIVHLKSLQLSA